MYKLTLDPDLAIVPRFEMSSSFVMPTPVSYEKHGRVLD